MSGSHNTLCINSFYPETELNITEIREYEKQILRFFRNYPFYLFILLEV